MIINITFEKYNLTSGIFQSETFDGILKKFDISFVKTSIDYLAEEVFESPLNQIDLEQIDYYDCKNFQLIKENKSNYRWTH